VPRSDNDNWEWWGAEPFSRRKIPLLIVTFIVTVVSSIAVLSALKRILGAG
jgi:hypothetical protein